MVHPQIPIDARMELVITEDDTSYLASFGHRRLARMILKDRLLVQVSAPLGRDINCYNNNIFPVLCAGTNP